jgi:hypothetical protein
MDVLDYEKRGKPAPSMVSLRVTASGRGEYTR